MPIRRLPLVLLVAAVALAACGGDDGEGAGPTTTAPGDATAEQRVLALGEEPVLADLLALGITPVASSANVVVDGGFVGLDELDTDGIEALVSTEPNFEQLAGFDADVVVATEFVVGEVGRDVLEGLGTLVVVPESDPEAQVLALGDAFDRRDEAEALLAELDQAITEGRAALGDDPPVVSVATIYPGPAVAAWVDGPVDIPATLLALGVRLQPGPGTNGAQGGRVYLSEEQLGILDAGTMVAMQTDTVEGEAEAIETMASNLLWTDLPAVAADRVVTVDRLGYPGIAGRIRLVDDLVAALGTA